MSNFDRVLSDAELISATFKAEMEGTVGELRAVEQAVLAKLAEQEPVAIVDYFDGVAGLRKLIDTLPKGMKLYAHPTPCVSNTSDKTACVSESGESEMQELLPLPKPNCRSPSGIGYFDSFTKDQMIDYAKSAIDHYRATSNHIADKCKMVTPLAQRKIQTQLDKGEYRVIENATVLVNEQGHAAIVNHGGAFYWVDNEGLAREFDGAGVAAETESREGDRQCKMVWCACGDGFEPDTFGAGFIAARGHCQRCDAEDKSSVLAESKAKIMAAAGWLADVCVMEIRGTETDKDVAEAYKALELRVAAELAIAQERANKEPEGWQLIPKEPTMDMIKALLETIVTNSRGGVVNPKTTLTYALAAAPKYTENKPS